jgi:plastocyanin
MLEQRKMSDRAHFGPPHRFWIALIASLVIAGCSGSKQPAPVQEAASPAVQAPEQAAAYTVQDLPGGVVEGRILLHGTPPPPKKVQVTQDMDTCGKTREIFPVRVEKGGVDDAVIWIDDIQHGKPFAFPPAEVRQNGCAYVPHVVIMAAGDLKISSQDPIPHNVHTYAKNNREYNESMNPLRRDISLTFARPEVISVRCDLHGWMQAYVVVAKNPYYVLSENGGNFRLENVPAGQYHLKIWSEALGESEQSVVVQAGQISKADFTLNSEPIS